MTVQELGGAAHGNECDAETIELELEPAQLRALLRPAGHIAVSANDLNDSSGAVDPEGLSGSADSRARVALLLCTSAAAALLAVSDAGVVRLPGVTVPRAAFVAAAPVERPTPLPKQPPVRFSNPFDHTEVFEFPAGTSRSAARAAVAKLLTERARGRFDLPRAKPPRHPTRRGATPPEGSSAT